MEHFIHVLPDGDREMIGWHQERSIVLAEAQAHPGSVPDDYMKILIDEWPEPEDNGLIPMAYYDRANNTVFYEYVLPPPPPVDEIQVLKQKQELMQLALDELILGGAL